MKFNEIHITASSLQETVTISRRISGQTCESLQVLKIPYIMFFRMGGCRNSNREVFMSWVFPLHTPGHRSQWEDLKPAKPKREAVCTTLLQQASRSMASCNVEKEQLGQIYLHLWQMKLSQIWVSTSYMEHLDIGYCQKHSTKTKT